MTAKAEIADITLILKVLANAGHPASIELIVKILSTSAFPLKVKIDAILALRGISKKEPKQVGHALIY